MLDDKTQLEKAVAQGKQLRDKTQIHTKEEHVNVNGFELKSKDEEIVRWVPELAGWEYDRDPVMWFCKQINDDDPDLKGGVI